MDHTNGCLLVEGLTCLGNHRQAMCLPKRSHSEPLTVLDGGHITCDSAIVAASGPSSPSHPLQNQAPRPLAVAPRGPAPTVLQGRPGKEYTRYTRVNKWTYQDPPVGVSMACSPLAVGCPLNQALEHPILSTYAGSPRSRAIVM